MKTIKSLAELAQHDEIDNPIGLTIGNFDGVHLGHRQLLQELRQKSLSRGLKFVVMTFIPHPQKILRGGKERFLLASYEQRRKYLEEIGVDFLVEVDFTRDFSTLSAEQFIKQHILVCPNVKDIYLGHDFAFGANKTGSLDVVKEVTKSLGIHVEIRPQYSVSGCQVSSTEVRNMLMTGQVAEASRLLGRNFALEGVVVKGAGRGKQIGFPTANLQVEIDLLIPCKGVYVTQTKYRNMLYNSVTNIGHNPTFTESQLLNVETNVFDFDTDIYGEKLEIIFWDKIRDEKKFSTVNELIEQLRLDVEHAKHVLSY